MAPDTLRLQVAAWLDRRMNGPETLCRPRAVMVFAPHPDDETLGCGGTVVKLRRAGVDVHIVFMTDGRHSHGARIAPRELAALRAQEAQAAVAELGVDAERVVCLAWEDGRLTDHQADAQAQVVALLAAHRPAAVFVPFRHDGPADHAATWRVVRGALQTHGHTVDVYEYPVWFWLHWPRAPIPRRGDGFLRHMQGWGAEVLLTGETDPQAALHKVLAGEALPDTRFDVTTALCKVRDLFSRH